MAYALEHLGYGLMTVVIGACVCCLFVTIAWGVNQQGFTDAATRRAAYEACSRLKDDTRAAMCVEIVAQGYPTTVQSQSITQSQSQVQQHP
jgi:uncharacterized iron-regulated membrane protein